VLGRTPPLSFEATGPAGRPAPMWSDPTSPVERSPGTRGPERRARHLLGPPGAPALNIRPGPQLATALAEIDDRPRHGRVPTLVRRDRVALRETKQIGHPLRVNHVIRVDIPSRDRASLQR